MRRRLEALLGAEALASGAAGPGVIGAGRGERPVRAAPASTQQVADLLGLCGREGWRVWPAGGSSRRLPDERFAADVLLGTERLAGITIYEPEDLTAGCRAGTSHGQLADATAPHRQMLPLEPAVGLAGTLGGTLALADAGPLRAGYGAPRDLALGLTVVTSDGRVLRVGGRVVKNVAGYDLVRLLVGSRGTLAVITELHVRLRGIPERDATALLAAPDAAGAAALALAIRDAAMPAALEVLAPPASGLPWQLAPRLHGSALAVADALAAVAAIGGRVDVLDPGVARDWWDGLAARERAVPVGLRLTVLPDRLGSALAACEQFLISASDNNLDARAGSPRRAAVNRSGYCAAHAADGIVRLGVHPPDRDRENTWIRALSDLVSEIVTLNGTWTYDKGAGAVRELYGAPEPPARPAALVRLERGLKARFDPRGLLPPWEV